MSEVKTKTRANNKENVVKDASFSFATPDANDKFGYWVNNETGKKFKFAINKGTPSGDVSPISKEEFIARNKETTTSVAIQKDKPFDLLSFPTVEEIDSITSDAIEQYGKVTEKLIENTRMYEASHNDIGSTFDAIISQAKNLTPSSGKGGKKLLVLIQKLFNAKEKLFSRYDTVKNKLDELNNVLKTQIEGQYSELLKINELEENHYKYIQQSKDDIKIIQEKLKFCQDIYDSWPEPTSQEDIIAMKKAERIIHYLRKKEEDVMAFITVSQQAILQNQARKETAETTIDDSKRIVNFIVPRYLESFINNVINNGSKKAASNNKNIKAEWNRVTQENSTAMKENYINSLEAKYSHLATEDTLFKQSTDVIEMLVASKKAHEKGMKESEEYMKTLQTINESIIEIGKKSVI